MKRSLAYSAAIVLLVIVSVFGAYRAFQRPTSENVVSVAAVVEQCKTGPSTSLTAWVDGYPVMAVTPMPMLRSARTTVVSYGTLWSAAFVGDHEPSAAIQLIAAVQPRAKPMKVSGPPLDLRWQGRTQLDLHGTISCSRRHGFPPEMVVDRTRRA